MPVLLYATTEADRAPRDFAAWAWIPDGRHSRPSLAPARLRAGLAAALETAFDREAETWWNVGRVVSMSCSAELAHMPACAPNASDFGQMLAWAHLVRAWAAEPATTLVLCDDPWMFRHLRTLPGVSSGRPPPIFWPSVLLRLRGWAARVKAASHFAIAAIRLRSSRRDAPKGEAALLVYGHPASTTDGIDGYFGTLMKWMPGLVRVLHVDCGIARARLLAADGRTFSLHGFGNPLFALTLPCARWRPSRADRRGEYGWLVRRAAAREAGTGQPAAIRWQIHCQKRWLRRCRPAVVAWPWENHSWERAFVRAARDLGVRTVGYQHSVVGRQMLNYAASSNSDGKRSLPDRVLCTGDATRDQILRWGLDPSTTAVGGALRFQRPARPAYDPRAPVFVALPFDHRVAAEMLAAIRRCAESGRRFVVKDHPMTPFVFADSNGVKRTSQPLGAQPAVSAVIFAATTVGLEAVLAGLPTLRFRSNARIALDILPDGITVPAADAESLCDALAKLKKPDPVDGSMIFAPVDEQLWRQALATS